MNAYYFDGKITWRGIDFRCAGYYDPGTPPRYTPRYDDGGYPGDPPEIDDCAVCLDMGNGLWLDVDNWPWLSDMLWSKEDFVSAIYDMAAEQLSEAECDARESISDAKIERMRGN